VPIPGTKRRKYLEENVAAESVQLDPAQMKVLDDALAPGKSLGQALRGLDHGDDRSLSDCGRSVRVCATAAAEDRFAIHESDSRCRR
jgi:hypothetical protein